MHDFFKTTVGGMSNEQQATSGHSIFTNKVHDLHFLGDVSNKHQQLLDSLKSVRTQQLMCAHSMFNEECAQS